MFTDTVYNIVARKVGTVPKNAENKLLVYTLITLTIVLIAIFINPGGTLTLCIFNFFPPPVLLVYPVQ